MSGLEAARMGDALGHSSAMAGLLIGAAVGLAVGALLVGTVMTGGLLGIVMGAALISSTAAGGALSGMYIGEAVKDTPDDDTRIITGSPNVIITGRGAARAGQDVCDCSRGHRNRLVAQGSSTVLVNNKLAGRKTDEIHCGAKITSACATVLFGGEAASAPGIVPESEVPPELVTGLTWIMLAGVVVLTGGVALTVGVGAALGMLGIGLVGGKIGGDLAEAGYRAAGGGELGARIARVLGETAGGFLGAVKGARVGAVLESRSRQALARLRPTKVLPAELHVAKPIPTEPEILRPADGRYVHKYNGKEYRSNYDVIRSVASEEDVVAYMNAHRERVVTLSEQLRQIAPERYGDVDPQLLRDYATQHDLAKVEDGSRFKGYLADSFGKNVGKSPIIDELNVRDTAIEDAFMTKNNVSPEMRAKLSEIVRLADSTDRGMDPFAKYEEFGRTTKPASEFEQTSIKKELTAALEKKYPEIIGEKDLYDPRAGASREAYLEKYTPKLPPKSSISPYTRTDGEPLVRPRSQIAAAEAPAATNEAPHVTPRTQVSPYTRTDGEPLVTTRAPAAVEPVKAQDARPPPAKAGSEAFLDKGYTISNDGMATWVKVPGDPRASVRIEPGADGLKVTDIFSGSQPSGSGSDMLAAGLKKSGLKSGGKFSFTGIINPETMAAYKAGVAPTESLLGKVGLKALDKLGLEASTVEYELVRGKLALAIGVK